MWRERVVETIGSKIGSGRQASRVMAAVAALLLLGAALVLGATTRAGAGLGQLDDAFVWVDDPLQSGSVQHDEWNNPGGSTPTVVRLAPGYLATTLDGFLGDPVLATSRQTGHRCAILDRTSGRVDSLCVDDAGVPVDSDVSILRSRTLVDPYVFSSDPDPLFGSYTVSGSDSNNPSGGSVVVRHLGTGVYRVDFTGYSGGANAQVTSADASRYCSVDAWTVARIDLTCYDHSGSAADSTFFALLTGTTGDAFALALDESASSYTPPAIASNNPSGGAITATRSGTGRYSIEFAGLQGRRGNVQVTAATTDASCSVLGWTADSAEVSCSDPTGALVDTPYSILWIRGAPNTQVFVDQSATGANNGTTWADAFKDLQDALHVAVPGQEIWVAEGTYLPDVASRSVSFEPADDVPLFGGFPAGGSAFEGRDPASHSTILSGDLLANDGPSIDPDDASRADNSRHVVVVNGPGRLLDGFVISGGNADGSGFPNDTGGGVAVTAGEATLTDVVLERNAARDGGGIAVAPTANLLAANLTVRNNAAAGSDLLTEAGSMGGGLHLLGRATIHNAEIFGNFAEGEGGALQPGNEDLEIVNAIIHGNRAGYGGATGRTLPQAELIFVHTTIANNHGILGTGGLRRGTGAIRMHNSILWGNTTDAAVNPNYVQAGTGSGGVSWWASVAEGSFVQIGSSTVWSGEYGFNVFDTSTAADPNFVDAAQQNFRLGLGSSARDLGNLVIVPADVFDLDGDGDVAEAVPLDLDGGSRVLEVSSDAGPYESPTTCPTFNRLHVDPSSGSAGDGGSWDRPLFDLSLAFSIAGFCPIIDEIWVAEGLYKPAGSDRTATFRLLDGVDVYGGFPAGGGVMSSRDPAAFSTILSGDHAGNDTNDLSPGALSRSENSYNVVTASDVETGGVLDGFVVEGGNANGGSTAQDDTNKGAGILVHDARPTFRNLTVRRNTATREGGGLYARSGLGDRVVVRDSSFFDNVVIDPPPGPGLKVGGSAIKSSFRMDLEIINSEIHDNTGDGHGAITSQGRDLTIVNSIVRDNDGGGVSAGFGSQVDLTIVNSLIVDNTGEDVGGVLVGQHVDNGTTATIVNTTIAANRATAIFSPVDGLEVRHATVTVSNSIVWNGFSNVDEGPGADITWEHSNVEDSGGSAGWDSDYGSDAGGNIDLEPAFVSSGGGDFRLTAGSPSIDAGDASLVPADSLDIDGDQDLVELTPELDLGRRVAGAEVDMGSFEFGSVVAPDAVVLFDDPCVVYDSMVASGSLGGTFDGGEVRSVQVTGVLSGQGGAGSCVPQGASAAIFRVSSVDPLTEGNLRMVPSGDDVAGGAGVVNYGAQNGLNNANTVTVPLSAGGAVDVEANSGPAGAVPTTDVRLSVIGYYSPLVNSDLRFFPLTPCAAADSRPNKGADATHAGPANDGFWGVGDAYPDIDILADFPAGQGGNNGVGNPNGNPTSCGVPAGAQYAMVNVVAIAPQGGAGFLSITGGGSDPVAEVNTPFAPLSPGMANGATGIVDVSSGLMALDIDGDPNAKVRVRVEVLGYFDDDPAGLEYRPVTPCTAFDSRPNKGATGVFAGLRKHGQTHATIYQVAGDQLPVGQGKVEPSGDDPSTGTCGVPDGSSAVLINLEAVNAVREGNFWASEAGVFSTGGVLNFNDLTPKMNNANAVVVPLDGQGRLQIEVNAGSFTAVGTDVAHARGVILGYYN